MRYYVTADVHGYYTQLIAALTEQGFFTDPEPHKLIICGDLFDRGQEAVKLQEFILELMEKDQVILIRGNHEDLTLKLLNYWHRGSYLQSHHHSNGTIDTLCQLTGTQLQSLDTDPDNVYRAFRQPPYINEIIPAMVDYYETDHYIFVHGWIPCSVMSNSNTYYPVRLWREASPAMWDVARWINGMEAAHNGILEKGKTIVCGHWHCSFGHSQYKNDGDEDGPSANYNPYYNDGIIALDACTPLSKKVNCIILED